MEKIKFLSALTLIGAAAFGLTACSSSDDAAGTGSNENGDSKYITVNLTSVGTAGAAGAKANPFTRAGEQYDVNGGKYENGTDNENTIKTARFYFFTSNGQPYMMTNGTNYLSVNNFEMKVGDNNTTVEKKTRAVLVINGVTGTVPRYMVCVANPNTETEQQLGTGSLTEDQLANAERKIASAHTGSGANASDFVMTSSTYDNSGQTVFLTSTDGHIFTSSTEATNNPVEMYVERLDAKVKTSLGAKDADHPWDNITYYTSSSTSDDIVASTTDGAYQRSGSIYPVGKTDEGTQVYALVKGWGVSDEEPKVSLLKDWSTKNVWGNYTSGDLASNLLGFTWNDASLYRSYWEHTAPMGQSDNLPVNHSFNYYAANAMGSYLYTNPNTQETTSAYATAARSAVTTNLAKVVVVAQLVTATKANGKTEYLPIEVGTYKSLEVLGLDNLKKAVLNDLTTYTYADASDVTSLGTTYHELTADDISFIPFKGGRAYEIVPQVVVKEGRNYYTGGNAHTATTADEINATLNNATYRATMRTGGRAYYYTPIRHLASVTGTPSQDSDYPLGYYGVVRNHIYDVTITSLKGFGTPVYDPTVVFDPITPTNSASYIAARINVLSWRMVTSKVDIDGTGI